MAGGISSEKILTIAAEHIKPQPARHTFLQTIRALFQVDVLKKYVAWAMVQSFLYQSKWKANKGVAEYVHHSLRSAEELVEALALVWEDGGHLLPMDPQTMDMYALAYKKAYPQHFQALVDRGLINPSDTTPSEKPPNEDPSILEKIDELLGMRPAPPSPDLPQRVWPRWWRGTGPKEKCPVTWANLTESLRKDVVQGTPLWHLMRRFFIGATRLRTLLQFDAWDTKERQTPLFAARLLLGLEHDAGFTEYQMFALEHGKIFEDMARIGYETLINPDELFECEPRYIVQECGMSVAPYLPCFFAQSPDGVVYDRKLKKWRRLIEIKCHYMKYEAYSKCPNIYIGQCIQGMLAHGVSECDFASMFYRCNSDSDYQAHDPRFVTFTLERLYMDPDLETHFRGYMVAFAFYTQLYGAYLDSIHAPYERQVRTAMELVRAHVIRLLPVVHQCIAKMRRKNLELQVEDEGVVKTVPMDNRVMHLNDFFGGDQAQVRRWFGKSVKNPPGAATSKTPPSFGGRETSRADELKKPVNPY